MIHECSLANLQAFNRLFMVYTLLTDLCLSIWAPGILLDIWTVAHFLFTISFLCKLYILRNYVLTQHSLGPFLSFINASEGSSLVNSVPILRDLGIIWMNLKTVRPWAPFLLFSFLLLNFIKWERWEYVNKYWFSRIDNGFYYYILSPYDFSLFL